MIEYVGDKDTTTTRMLEGILAMYVALGLE
jgi:hypothetical protein